MSTKTTILTIAAMTSVTIAAQGAWSLGDPHKIHYPQLPDPNGWDVNIQTIGGGVGGWKTSLDHFNDFAVHRFDQLDPWEPIVDPFGGPGFDMAFVITPEPGATVLALLGAGFLFRRRR